MWQYIYLFVLPEPVDVEDLGHVAALLRHGQPVPQVVSEVVAEERSHCERIVHHYFSLRNKFLLKKCPPLGVALGATKYLDIPISNPYF